MVVDDFERAMEHLDASDPGTEGVKAIHAKLLATLAHHGVTRQDALGERFDPALHEAVGSEPSPLPENTVLKQWAPAYSLHARLLRAARVVLAAAPVEEEPVDEEPVNDEPVNDEPTAPQRVLVTPPPDAEERAEE